MVRFTMRVAHLILLSTFILIFELPRAQTNSDTIGQANALLKQGGLEEAFSLLQSYHKKHRESFEAVWLFAQTAYWSGEYQLSRELYESAIRLQSQNLLLQSDYVKMLTQIGKYSKATEVNHQLLQNYPDHLSALQNKAVIEYYTGKLNAADHSVGMILELDPANEAALLLQRDIQASKALWIRASVAYGDDDQPLQYFRPLIEAGFRKSAWLNPRFSVGMPLFVADTQNFSSISASAENEFMFVEQQLRIKIQAGLFRYPQMRQTEWTGKVHLSKKISKSWDAWASWERKPYVSTLSSLYQSIVEEDRSIGLRLNRKESWNGEFMIISSQYPGDQNSVFSLAGWLFAPSITMKSLSISLGYGFSYGDAKESRFSSVTPLDDIISNQLYLDQIQGIYDPYFTPRNQSVHSILAVLEYKSSERFSLLAAMNYGFYARSDYPYLYLDQKNSGKLFIDQGFEKTSFTPTEFKMMATRKLGKKMSLSGDIKFNNTLFYKSFGANLSVRTQL